MWRKVCGGHHGLLRACLVFAGSVIGVAAASAGQSVPLEGPSTAPPDTQTDIAVEHPAARVARLLADRHAFVEIPRKGKVTRKIELKDETYAMPGGPSRVVLLRLPHYQEPYALTVRSFLVKRAMSRTENIFVPSAIMLDADFVVTRTVPETELRSKSAGMIKGPAVEVTIPFIASQAGERFALVYTQASAVGQSLIREPWQPNGGLPLATNVGSAIGDAFIRRQRSGHGMIQIQTKPTK